MPSEGLGVQTAFLTVPKPNALDSRLRGNDEILSYGKLSEKQKLLRRHFCEIGNPDTRNRRNLFETTATSAVIPAKAGI